MNMTPKSMSSNESSGEGDNIVMRLHSNPNEKNPNSSNQMNNFIKFKLDEIPETSSKRNIIQKRKPDYDEYLERSSSNKSKKKKSSIESRNRVYECIYEDCRKIFNDKGSYRKHQLTHGEKQYLCNHPGCGKKFLDNSKLRRHTLVHTGEKPFRCELCSKKFSLDFNLRTHLRIHTGEKPYACTHPGCFKRFSQSSNLTAHEKTHINQKLPIQILPQASIPTQRPIFPTNPLNYMINNEYSGTLNINNLSHINRLYEMMKDALIQENTNNYGSSNIQNPGMIFATTSSSSINKPPVLFTTTNSSKLFESSSSNIKPNRLFTTVKGKKIFNIVKEPNPNSNRRKTVKIIYKNEEDYSCNNISRNYNYDYQEENEEKEEYNPIKNEGYEDNRDEEYENNEEEENVSVKHEDAHENIFDSGYPNFLNIFK